MSNIHTKGRIVTAIAMALVMNIGHAATKTIRAPNAAEPAASATTEPTPEERLKRNQVSADNEFGDTQFHVEQAKGLKGDRDAAFQVAQMFRNGSNGAPRDERRMLQWLLHASSLKHPAASYQLYQYYLELRLDRDAVFFENRALEQGYVPPPRLDPRRG